MFALFKAIVYTFIITVIIRGADHAREGQMA